jgi:hypothetical protein
VRRDQFDSFPPLGDSEVEQCRKGIKQQSSLVLDRTLDCGFGLTDLAKGAFGADSKKLKPALALGSP